MNSSQHSTCYDLPGVWPSAQQTLVLKAALGHGDEARHAWDMWRASIDLEDDFDGGCFRLLPLLYHNLRRLGVEDSLMPRLRGVYRRAWVESNQLFFRIRGVIQELANKGIPTLLLKGAPLALDYYPAPALRPMADVDILVPVSAVRDAIGELQRAGCNRDKVALEDSLRFRHAIQFFAPDGTEFDLHWYVMIELLNARSNQTFWDRSLPLDFQGIPTRRLSSTDSLLHVILHGIRRNREPAIRWIADSMMILQSDQEPVDWSHLIKFAHDHKLAYRLSLGLHYLAETFNAPVPRDVLADLSELRISVTEQMENTHVLSDWSAKRFGRIPILSHGWIIFTDYFRFATQNSVFEAGHGFSHYVRFRWGLQGRRQIPGVLAKSFSNWMRRQIGAERERPVGPRSYSD